MRRARLCPRWGCRGWDWPPAGWKKGTKLASVQNWTWGLLGGREDVAARLGLQLASRLATLLYLGWGERGGGLFLGELLL